MLEKLGLGVTHDVGVPENFPCLYPCDAVEGCDVRIRP
jgi:hypothetical protein